MPATPPKPVVPRKRTRKRKKRAAISSSESSSDSDSSSGSSDNAVQLLPTTALNPHLSCSSSSSDSEESDSDSSSSSAASSPAKTQKSKASEVQNPKATTSTLRRSSPSLSPPPAELPSFLPPKSAAVAARNIAQEQAVKDRFRQFWMASVADGFKEDLEEIRKEHDLGTTRLALLIDSLASGAEVFTPRRSTDINEMEVVLS